METIPMKICNKCNIEKPVSEFSFYNDKPLYSCKQCQAAKTKKWLKKLSESTDPMDMLNDTFYKMLQATRSNAKTNHIPCELSLPILRAMYDKQKGKCYYTGVQMTLRSKGHLDRDPLLISFDRKNSDEGYTPTNTVLCCWGIHSLKGWLCFIHHT